MTDSRGQAPDDGATGSDNTTYSYRASLLGSGCRFRLAPNALKWEVGAKSGEIPYREITRIRMSFRPATMQTHRFITEIWGGQGPKLDIASTSWKSLVEQERLDRPYAAFVTELHRRVAPSGAAVVYETGGNAVKYWFGLTLFAGVALGLAFLVARAAQLAAWGGAAFIGVFLIIFLWQAGNYFRRNRPSRYEPDSLPAVLLP